jgi:hypothetical protein
MRYLQVLLMMCAIGLFASCADEKKNEALVYYVPFSEEHITVVENQGVNQFNEMCQYSINYEDFQTSFKYKIVKPPFYKFGGGGSAEVFLPSGEHYIIEQDGLTILLSKGMYGVEYGMINQDKFVNFLLDLLQN